MTAMRRTARIEARRHGAVRLLERCPVLAVVLALVACARAPQAPGDRPGERPLVAAGPAMPQRITNTLGMVMVRVPAGEFDMGAPVPDATWRNRFPSIDAQRLASLTDEQPVHRVRITRDFYLGRTEVTVGQFRRFLEASGHVPESVADGTGGYGYNPLYDPSTTRRGDAFEGRSPGYSWRWPGFAQTDEHPVVNVTWNDAKAMADWLSRTEGRRYRLPTEAEWEYACRAGTRTHFHSGDDLQALAGVANLFDPGSAALWPQWREHAAPHDDGHVFTAPVASYSPNAFGLFDMHGNVWEWTADWHGDDYYAQSPTYDPPGPADGTVRVRRGGSWHTWPFYARCAYRNWNAASTRYTLVGIRLLMQAR
jgi:formylglycine-generating enzyme required for sulfatase activity